MTNKVSAGVDCCMSALKTPGMQKISFNPNSCNNSALTHSCLQVHRGFFLNALFIIHKLYVDIFY
jgi:hypothetical protein